MSHMFQVTPLTAFRRFLMIGSYGANCKVSGELSVEEHQQNILDLIGSVGSEVVDEIVAVASRRLALRQDPALYALALCATHSSLPVRKAAYSAALQICKHPTALFSFIDYCEKVSQTTGWGKLRKQMIADWYTSKTTRDLVYHITKYKQRGGWSHRDLLRLGHVRPKTASQGAVFKYLVKDTIDVPAEALESDSQAFSLLEACSVMAKKPSVQEAVEAVKTHNLVWEQIPTELHNSPEVWKALIPNMPIMALLRNLGRFANLNISDGDELAIICSKLTSPELVAGKLHPISVLIAYKQYLSGGTGGKGKLRWTPNKEVSTALQKCLDIAFQPAASPVRVCIGVDVSGSMSCPASGVENLSCAEVALALSFALWKQNPGQTAVRAFSSPGAVRSAWTRTEGLVDLKFNENTSYIDVLRSVSGMPFSSTDCSLPIRTALRDNEKFDAFIMITDNENNCRENPAECLRKYREHFGINAKLITLSLSASSGSIADPADAGMLDLVGMNGAVPSLIEEFLTRGF